MADPFDSAWAKWGQAVLHAHDLFDEINSLHLTEENFCKMRTEYEPKRHCLSTRVVWIADPLPILGLILGDVVHNYRSCLDHLAWALVVRGKTPPSTLTKKQQTSIYFPYSGSRDDFTAALKGRFDTKGRRYREPMLPGVLRADAAIVRRYQPYLRGKRSLDLHTLAILATLSNRDKHREIWPILVIPQSAMVFTWPPQDFVVNRTPEGNRAYPLQVGAEVHRAFGRKTGPNPSMQVHPQLTVEPALTPRVTVREWLTQTRSFVYQLLREFAPPPARTLEDLGVDKVVDIPELRPPA
jgi:hypothetical protein